MAGTGCPCNEFLYHLQIASKLAVVFLTETLQINVHGVHIGKQLLQYFRRCASVCHQDIVHPPFLHQPSRIPHIFPAHQRLIIGKRQTNIAKTFKLISLLSQNLRADINGFGQSPSPSGHGDRMVLAKGTA